MAMKLVTMGEDISIPQNTGNHYVKKQTKEQKERRTRHWGTLCYPDSYVDGARNLSENWIEIIKESRVPCIISPLHDRDVTETGEPKKPHYHVIFSYANNKSREQVQEFVDRFGGVGVEPIQNMTSYVPYIWHDGEADKAQYNPDDCRMLNGFQLKDFVKEKETKMFREIVDVIEDNAIYYIDVLMEYLANNADNPEMVITQEHFAYVRKNSYMWVNYLKSKAHRQGIQNKREHDAEFAQLEFLLARLKQMGFDQLPADFTFQQLECFT